MIGDMIECEDGVVREVVEPIADRLGGAVSWCGVVACTGPSRCRPCKNAYMRAWRRLGWPDRKPQHTRARAIAGVAQRRGRLKPQSCEVCGEKAEKHHDDYNQPLNVRWLCRECHLALHRRLANG